jgi:hypothetical protein
MQAVLNQQYEIEFQMIPGRTNLEDPVDVTDNCLRRDSKQRVKINEFLHHRYLAFKSIDYGLIESSLPSFLLMIQDDYNDVDFEKSSVHEVLKLIGEELWNGAAIIFPEIDSRGIIPR